MKVMCIDNINRLPDMDVYLNLTINAWYNVEKKLEGQSLIQFLIINDIENYCYYDGKRFITEKELRKQKLQKINEKS
jgi:hypothetical protein